MLTIILVSLCAALTGQIIDGIKLYDSTKQVCCNATLYDRTGANSLCCGDQSYESDKALCCNDEIVPIPDGGKPSDYTCCLEGEGVYKYETEMCCDGKILQKDNSGKMSVCCGDKLYHWDEAVCCGDQLHQLADNETSALKGCCGDKVFNYDEFMCCNDKLLENQGHSTSCCGDKSYDFEKQLCCTSFPIDDIDFKNAKSTIVPKEGTTTSCCGMQSYNYETHVCCGDKVKPKPEGVGKSTIAMCCGDDFLTDYETQMCCKDKVLPRQNSATQCCGDKSYNSMLETCCNDEVHPKEKGVQCCWGAKKLYDEDKQYCCREDVLEVTEDDKKNGRSDCCERSIPMPHIMYSGPGFAQRRRQQSRRQGQRH